jgi:hypothetical protein
MDEGVFTVGTEINHWFIGGCNPGSCWVNGSTWLHALILAVENK